MADIRYFTDYYDVQNVYHKIEIYSNIGEGNLVKNGGFTSAFFWTFTDDWKWATDSAECIITGGSGVYKLFQPGLKAVSGTRYEIKFTVVSSSDPDSYVFVGFGELSQNVCVGLGPGEYSKIITADDDVNDFAIGLVGANGEECVVTDVSLTLVTSAPFEYITGTAEMDYGNNDDILTPIRGQGLRLSLDADNERTFEDLFTANEKSYSVIYYRDNVVMFRGWVDPQGYYQSLVHDRWVVSVDCLDGLSYLENMAFTQLDGTIWIGKIDVVQAIVYSLLRTGVEAKFNISIGIYYTGLSDALDVTQFAMVNSKRFERDDKEQTLMSCAEVLNSMLSVFGACVTMLDGEWFIYRPTQIARNPVQDFFHYNETGHDQQIIQRDLSFLLGSQENGFYPHFAGENQSLSIDKAVGAHRIDYKYGILRSALENFNFYTADGFSYDDWVINNPLNINFPPPDNFGVGFEVVDQVNTILQMSSVQFNVPGNTPFDIVIRYTGQNQLPENDAQIRVRVRFQGTNPPSKDYYLTDGNIWSESISDLEYLVVPFEQVRTLVCQATPELGDIWIEIFTPFGDVAPDFGVWFTEVSITRGQDQTSGDNILGSFWTFQRGVNPSSVVLDNSEVFVADNLTDLYVGTLYKDPGVQNTSTWFRKSIGSANEEKPLIQIMGEERMRLYGNNAYVFSGTIFGYVPYLSVVTIDGYSGYFMFQEWRYDTMNNTVDCKLKQVFTDELDGDILFTAGFDYGTTVKPTIREF